MGFRFGFVAAPADIFAPTGSDSPILAGLFASASLGGTIARTQLPTQCESCGQERRGAKRHATLGIELIATNQMVAIRHLRGLQKNGRALVLRSEPAERRDLGDCTSVPHARCRNVGRFGRIPAGRKQPVAGQVASARSLAVDGTMDDPSASSSPLKYCVNSRRGTKAASRMSPPATC